MAGLNSSFTVQKLFNNSECEVSHPSSLRIIGKIHESHMQSAVSGDGSAGLVLVLFTITECEKNQNNCGNLLLACVFVRTKKTSRNKV